MLVVSVVAGDVEAISPTAGVGPENRSSYAPCAAVLGVLQARARACAGALKRRRLELDAGKAEPPDGSGPMTGAISALHLQAEHVINVLGNNLVALQHILDVVSVVSC